MQYLGIFLGLFVSLGCNIILKNGWQNPFMSQIMPDWLFLMFVFCAMREGRLWLVWAAWFAGLLYSIAIDELFGFYSVVYAVVVLIVQNARFRLLVVSSFERGVFLSILMLAYLFVSGLTFRLSADSVHSVAIIAFLVHSAGWLCMAVILQSLAPLSQQRDLFSE